jgi:molybdopterin-binding protein
MPVVRISEAAALLGVSDDTIRRWAEAGRLPLVRQPNGRLGVQGSDLAAMARERSGGDEIGPVVGQSARNRFPGIVTAVVRDTVMAQVEIQAGRFRIVSLLSREAVDELGLEPGVLAVALVKATNVVVEVAGS